MTDEAARGADKWGKDEKRLMEERSPDFRRALFSAAAAREGVKRS